MAAKTKRRNAGRDYAEHTFRTKAAAERYAAVQRRAGRFASVVEEPITPHASTKRERARRVYIVQHESGKSLSNPPSVFIPCKAVKITRNRGKVEVRIRK